mgnify:CR=1
MQVFNYLSRFKGLLLPVLQWKLLLLIFLIINFTSSKQNAGRHEMEINTSTLRNGMYIVTLATTERTISQKVQILH